MEHNHLSGFSTYTTQYDFAGNVVKTHERHEKHEGLGVTHNLLTENTYDDRGRLVGSVTTLDGTSAPMGYAYNELGQLAVKTFRLDDATGLNYLFKATHTYNIQGWLTKREAPNFRMELDYFGTAGYTGNIAKWTWDNSYIQGQTQSYTYTYDGFGRETSAIHSTGEENETNITYDRNGNFKTFDVYGQTHRYNYTYSHSGNRMIEKAAEVIEISTGTPIWSYNVPFTYDANGNTTFYSFQDLNLSYNYLNLPLQLRRASDNAVLANYAYDAMGRKLQTYNADTTVVYDYLGSLTVIDNNGATTVEAGFGDGLIRGGAVVFHEKDHLGSIRVSMNSVGAIAGRNDYWPFGTRIGSATTPIDPNNRHFFNGKEGQTLISNTLLDYGARLYDSDIPTWLSPDPLAEKYYSVSPYAFSGNNPVRYVDPNGMWVETANGFFTDDQIDIERFTTFQNTYSDYGLNASMREISGFVGWEMSGGSSSGFYPSRTLGSNISLQPAVMTGQSGQWGWDESNRRQIYAGQKAFVEQGDFFYSSTFADHLIAAGSGLSSAGGNLGLLGAGLTLTEGGAVVGVPMMKLGEYIGVAGNTLRGFTYAFQGRSELAYYTLGLTGATFGLSNLINYGAKAANVSDRAMLTPFVLTNFVNSLIERGEIQMMQGSITITK